MKIKTITCHDVYNCGASLQAYALFAYLTSLGHDVEIINYKPEYLRHYRLTGVNNPVYDKPFLREIYQIVKFPGRLKARFSQRKKEYDHFTEKFLSVTDKLYNSNEELKENPPLADVYFAGSDQIWNSVFKNGRDPAFYLDFAPVNATKASYAASFATASILDEYKNNIKLWLSKLDYISVRESSGIDIIKQLGINTVTQVLDPVFLLSKNKWEDMAENEIFSEPYIFLYDFDQNEYLGRLVKAVADKNNWKIYSYLHNPLADKCFEKYGPLTFLSLVKNAELVMSNSFHATAFSLIFEKDFWVINRKEKINTRMRDLLDLFDISNRLLRNNSEDLCSSIDYSEIRDKIAVEIRKSKDFINKVLECKK